MTLINQFAWLALCIYMEARGEPFEGKVAVAHVVMNRAVERHLSLEEVIKQPHQFSWYEDDVVWTMSLYDYKHYIECAKAAYQCLEEISFGDNFHGANHYFNPNVVNPTWAQSMNFIVQIGNHRFFRG